nr:divergent polysaccharide deacetylase family protein [Roseovarius gahaiensis]
MTAPPVTTSPEAAALDVPASSEFDQSREDREADLPASDQGTSASASAPKVAPPEPDDLTSLQDADTAPAGQPETAQPENGLSAPEVGDDASGVQVESDSPVLPSPQAMAPTAPADDDNLSISTEPAQPAAPDVEDGGAFDGPQSTPEASTTPEDAQSSDLEAEPEARAPQADSADQDRPSDEIATIPNPTPDQAAQNEADTAVDAQPDDTATEEPERQATIGNMAQGVTTGRLPSMADTPDTPDTPDTTGTNAETRAATPPDETDAADGGEAEDTRPPLERFATAFDNPEGKPLMSIVLIDDGDSAVGLEALSGFPYPISFAIDPGWPGAAEAARRYREAGFETLAMAYLPPGASPADTEVAMQAQMAAVPNAVAVFEAPDADLQSNRDASEQLASILSASGHGLVMYPQGLNTAQKLIAKDGVPSATIFRDFDASGQDATVIRRFLDQAAFKASREEGGVIMVGRLRPDTISALLLWGLQDRASTVALAPVSAILRQD